MNYIFFEGNLVAGKFELTSEQVTERFQQWLPTKDIQWINYYDGYSVISSFITDKNGLNSVSNGIDEQNSLIVLLKPYLRTYKKLNTHEEKVS